MISPRYEVYARRRTARFSVYAIYDNLEKRGLIDPTSRERSEIVAVVKSMNAAER